MMAEETFTSQSCLRKKFYCLLDQFRRRLIWITGRVVFDRAISSVVVLFQDGKGARQINMHKLALFIGFVLFHVAYPVSASEHCVDGTVGVSFIVRR